MYSVCMYLGSWASPGHGLRRESRYWPAAEKTSADSFLLEA